jgi:hypothetical protein
MAKFVIAGAVVSGWATNALFFITIGYGTTYGLEYSTFLWVAMLCRSGYVHPCVEGLLPYFTALQPRR